MCGLTLAPYIMALEKWDHMTSSIEIKANKIKCQVLIQEFE